MKTYKPQEPTEPTEAPQPRLYTWDEVKNNEGVYKSLKSPNGYFISITEFGEGLVLIYGKDTKRLVPGTDYVWSGEKFQKLENAKVVFDVIEG